MGRNRVDAVIVPEPRNATRLDPFSLGGGSAWERKVPRTVLVVDDEPLVREITASMLLELGCEVKTAGNGKEALKKLAADRRIEILITAVNMPGMNGYDLAEAARRMRIGLAVIVLSGRETDTHGYPLIQKPFVTDDLKEVMAQHTGLC
jgi:CheY-like chemotaxis protein